MEVFIRLMFENLGGLTDVASFDVGLVVAL